MAKNLKCPKCDRMFGLPGHLARHLSATHGVKGQRAKKAGGGKAGRRGPGRPPGSKNKVRAGGPGRPSALVSRLGLRDMSLDQLSEVIEAAKSEGRRKLATMQEMF